LGFFDHIKEFAMTIRSAIRLAAACGLTLALLLSLAGPALAQTQQRPPEYNEVLAASRIIDAAARLKEFERLKTAYPAAQMGETIDAFIQNARVELAPSLDAVITLQKEFLGQGVGPRRATSYLQAASQLLEHPKVASFDKAKVLDTVSKYRDAGTLTAKEPETLAAIPGEDQRKAFAAYYANAFQVIVAKAQLNAGNAPSALITLEAYKAAGGALDADYYSILGDAQAQSGKDKEAYEAYLKAAVDNAKGAATKALALYKKINGKEEGFLIELEKRSKQLPYAPEAFEPPAGWKGKVVLAEIFTGSECPPCVAADLGFDGLIESYPAKYLAVLEYHLPIPAPDPMMNPATKKRAEVYAASSTPTVVIDGDNKMIGGGSRSMAGGKFKQYKAAVDAKLAEAPAVELKITAAKAGDTINVAFSADAVVPGADYIVVLVQKEENYKGSNGLQFHKLVVRDLLTVNPAGPKTASFALAASEKATDAYLTDFEKTYTRIANFKFAERHAIIARQGLKVVFFVQDRTTKKVLNAAVADVK
jgi:thiol-disulfide isomerase/thioredoxin